jgi:DNA-binding response OmpR family regulator
MSSSTILIAEHDPAILELIVDILTDEGYSICAMSTGCGGLAEIEVGAPAVTLFDMALPDLSAGGLISRLQALGLSDVHLILMTTLERNAAPLLVAGSIECLLKPFELSTILDMVARHAGPQLVEVG